ncbi:MAG: (2Fe-2S)-binding protein [Deltaproteobacteria bacterium]|nr:(2Fe-2S)-binding protein [Deltaproteobacteria bacterium]
MRSEVHRLKVNGEEREVTVAGDTPLLWVLREQLGLTGTKFGCGEQLCGACTVLIDGAAERACGTSVADAVGSEILTIEGLKQGGVLHPVQQAWLDERVSQCGYCQPGQILAVVALLGESPRPTDREIDLALEGNLCRCGTYPRIRRGVHRAAALLAGEEPT